MAQIDEAMMMELFTDEQKQKLADRLYNKLERSIDGMSDANIIDALNLDSFMTEMVSEALWDSNLAGDMSKQINNFVLKTLKERLERE